MPPSPASPPDGPIVIVGGGHAGAALCTALAAAGQAARVHLVCAEPELPYHRPPLSKSLLKNPQEAVQPHRADGWFAEAGITLHRGDPAVALDAGQRRLTLRSGTVLPYRWLVLATGARARTLPALPADVANVALLRSAADALKLREQLAAAERVTVLGGGFIGLEIAATARALGKAVVVLESAPRLLQRSVSAELASHVLDTHLAAGIDVRTGAAVTDIEIADARVAALSVDGRREPVDLLVLGIGAVPDTALAEAAGLGCDNGIPVDDGLRTADPAILAIGDCASFPAMRGPGRLRLESVQNANDQARTAAATIAGTPARYAPVPWFWSEQGGMRLQMAGLMPDGGTVHRRAGATPAGFSLLHYADGRLACVESVNAPMDHLAARKLLEAGVSPPPDQASDPGRPLKGFVPAG